MVSSSAIGSNAYGSFAVLTPVHAGESLGKPGGVLLPVHISAPPGESPIPGGLAGVLPERATPDEIAAILVPFRGSIAEPKEESRPCAWSLGPLPASTQPLRIDWPFR